jgi:hypothetical protein
MARRNELVVVDGFGSCASGVGQSVDMMCFGRDGGAARMPELAAVPCMVEAVMTGRSARAG